jgi:hypothetical protein
MGRGWTWRKMNQRINGIRCSWSLGYLRLRTSGGATELMLDRTVSHPAMYRQHFGKESVLEA